MNIQKHVYRALLLLSTQIANLKADTDYEGSEEFLDLDLACYNLVCDLVGFDIAEDNDWSAYTIKATQVEICEYAITQLLTRFKEFIPASDRLYVVAFEASYVPIADWKKVLNYLIDVFVWTPDNLQIDMGWSLCEVQQLNGLDVHQSLICYSTQENTIFRLR